ncbi:hypothetical protein E2K93_11860 [Thalassotalea sp. HSM 43]|uniref:hypothetical protein n=1 Tax=Thalassotalea sp. HSM 43 TaxID=2552945 RepID=UPI001081A5C9|nr:hypothetical protein [Thalassotalea sp. HSM 43]QBY05037.1 hypothetical protein E2K93_11860 [Thalassotalea sp. HSM 43]
MQLKWNLVSKKTFSQFDAVIVLCLYFCSDYLLDAYFSGEIYLRAISISKELNPVGFWLTFLFTALVLIAALFYLLFYDFKASKFYFRNRGI